MLWLRFNKCNNSTLGIIEFVSPFDTIFVANTHERSEEGRMQRRLFLKEFKVMGQICREGRNESGILPKAQYAMTIFYLSGVAGSLGKDVISPRKLQRSCSTQYQKMPPKKHFLGTFLSVCCIQIERKNPFN